MSYRLKVKEPLAEGIRRIALDQIEIAEGQLRANTDADAAVHNARRALKRLRALLRLIRPGLDEAVYRRETRRFAETGRLLAGERDRHVMRQTLAKLQAQPPGLPPTLPAAFEALLAKVAKAKVSPDDARRKAAAKLAAARKALSGTSVDGIEIAHVFAGIEKVYRKARKLADHCQQGATDEEFHALRKSVQQHWRHMQLLSRAWPEALSARAAEAKALSQLLGDDHDLSVLMAFVTTHADALAKDDVDSVQTAVREAQGALRQRVHWHGTRLFAERPADLVERLRAYWSATQGLTGLSEPAEVADEAAPQPPVTEPPAPVRARRRAPAAVKAAAPRKRRVLEH